MEYRPIRGFPDSSVGKESVCNAGDPSLIPVRKIHWRRDRLPTPVFFGFPGGSAGKESACNVGDLGSMPGLGRSPREGYGYPLQYSGLKKSMNCIVHGVAKSRTRLSDFHFHKPINNDSFRWIVKGFSHTYTCIQSPPNSSPIQVAI